MATIRHLDVTVFQINPISSLFVESVVVGSATVLASNEAPHVIARAAVHFIDIHNCCESVGVQERLVVKEVISAACAVNE